MIKILLIEDDLPTVEIYKEVFKKAKFKVEAINWGRDALSFLEKIKQNKKIRPDLILLDLILPDINGIDILKEIKEDENLKKIPVFVLTNYTDPELEKESYRVGAEKYIVKANLVPSQLVDLIKSWKK